MICPMVSIADQPIECIKEKCAWWDNMRHWCILKSIVCSLDQLWSAQDNLAREINRAVLRK